MAATVTTGKDISTAEESPMLNGALPSFADFKGRPTVRSKSGCWKSAFYILPVELIERFAYCGIKSNLINYLTGPLGLSTAAALGNVNAWIGTAEISPLFGALIADAFLGRYQTLILSSLLYILGLGFLSLSAALRSFNYSDCTNALNNGKCSPSTLHVTFFFFSLYLAAFAQGGHRPCLQAFGTDQFDEEDQIECRAKSSFFNWWNFFVSSGSLVAFMVLSWIQENISWELGFGIPCMLMCFALLLFSLGTGTYRFRISRDERNPFVRIGWVVVRAVRNWWGASTTGAVSVAEEAGETQFHEGFSTEHYFQMTSVRQAMGACGPGDIEDAKAILRLVPIWSTCLGFAIVLSQTATLFTKQGTMMNRYITSNFQIPAASLQSFVTLPILVFLPIYDRIFIPIARATLNEPSGITVLQRIGTGMFFSIITMIVAASVERKRLATDVVMSIWWLVPQYLLCGTAYVFSAVGLQEFFYDQVPQDLKSIGLALYLSDLGTGNLVSSFLISVVEKATSGGGRGSWFSDDLNRAHIDYFYWLLAGISGVAFAAYVYFARSFVYNNNRTPNF